MQLQMEGHQTWPVGLPVRMLSVSASGLRSCLGHPGDWKGSRTSIWLSAILIDGAEQIVELNCALERTRQSSAASLSGTPTYPIPSPLPITVTNSPASSRTHYSCAHR